MTEVVYSDGFGATITLTNVDGRHLTSTNSREQWRAARHMKTRPDDVFICEYPKSGLHWVWEIVSMLRAGDATPMNDLMEYHMLDFAPADMLLREDPSMRPRTLTSHKYPQELPKMALEQNCKIILLLRDPKDICVSYYHHLVEQKSTNYEGEFKNFIKLFLDGKVPFDSWSEYIKQWSCAREADKENSFLVVFYEDFIKNPDQQIRRLSDFLGVTASDDLIKQVVTNTSFKSMKEHKEAQDNPLRSFFKHDKQVMYRKGEAGDWRNWFDESQQREFDEILKSRLTGVTYQRIADLDRYFSL